MAVVLGINAVFHDPAAAVVRDGVVVAAAEEERFSRRKHGKEAVPFSTWELPVAAVRSCLDVAGVTVDKLDAVAYSYDPSLAAQPSAPAATVRTSATVNALAVRDSLGSFFISLFMSACLGQGFGDERRAASATARTSAEGSRRACVRSVCATGAVATTASDCTTARRTRGNGSPARIAA